MDSTGFIILNVQTVLSPNVGKFINDGYEIFTNEDFNIFLVPVTVILTFAIQTAVSWFAYRRGKQIFMKNHIRIIDEYETDENV